jgi:hypothetical protein
MLIAAGALDSWSVARRQQLWQLGTLHYAVDQFDLPIPHADAALPPQSRAEAFEGELLALGLSPDEQIMAFYRTQLEAAGVLNSATLEDVDDGQPLAWPGYAWCTRRRRRPGVSAS